MPRSWTLDRGEIFESGHKVLPTVQQRDSPLLFGAWLLLRTLFLQHDLQRREENFVETVLALILRTAATKRGVLDLQGHQRLNLDFSGAGIAQMQRHHQLARIPHGFAVDNPAGSLQVRGRARRVRDHTIQPLERDLGRGENSAQIAIELPDLGRHGTEAPADTFGHGFAAAQEQQR